MYPWFLCSFLKHKTRIKDYNKPRLQFCSVINSHGINTSCSAEPRDCCSSSLPRTQSTVVLIKSCAALLTSSPMVILGHGECDGCCKPPREPIRASISPHGAFMHSFLSISHICLNIGLEFDCENYPAIVVLDHTWGHMGESQALDYI